MTFAQLEALFAQAFDPHNGTHNSVPARLGRKSAGFLLSYVFHLEQKVEIVQRLGRDAAAETATVRAKLLAANDRAGAAEFRVKELEAAVVRLVLAK